MAGFLARWFLPFVGIGRGRVSFGLGGKSRAPAAAPVPVCPVATDYSALLLVATDDVTTLLVATDTVTVLLVATDSCC